MASESEKVHDDNDVEVDKTTDNNTPSTTNNDKEQASPDDDDDKEVVSENPSTTTNDKEEVAVDTRPPPIMVKTKKTTGQSVPCTLWAESGECRYEDKCRFKHGEGDDRPIYRAKRPARTHTKTCRYIRKGKPCRFGDECKFRHDIKVNGDESAKKKGGRTPKTKSSPKAHNKIENPQASNEDATECANDDAQNGEAQQETEEKPSPSKPTTTETSE